MVEAKNRRIVILADKKYKQLQLNLATLEQCFGNSAAEGFPIPESMKQEYGSRVEAGNSITALITKVKEYCISVHVARGFPTPAGKPTSHVIPPKPSRRVESPAERLADIAAAARQANSTADEAARGVTWCKCRPLREFCRLSGDRCSDWNCLILNGAKFCKCEDDSFDAMGHCTRCCLKKFVARHAPSTQEEISDALNHDRDRRNARSASRRRPHRTGNAGRHPREQRGRDREREENDDRRRPPPPPPRPTRPARPVQKPGPLKWVPLPYYNVKR